MFEKENNILFVGDPHLSITQPENRLDSYRETTIKKLESILELAKSKRVNVVVFVGDMFHRHEEPTSYIIRLLKVFQDFQGEGIKCYTIVGNHDLLNNRMESLQSSSLGILIHSGALELLKSQYLISHGVYLHGISFTEREQYLEKEREEVGKIQDSQLYKIGVVHYATDNTIPYESISREELNVFDAVFMGHDHTPYGIDGANPVVIRTGSLTRRTKDAYNLERKIELALFKPTTKTWEKVELPNVRPSQEVFKSVVFNDVAVESVVNFNFGKAFDELKNSEVKSDIFEIVDWVVETGKATEDTANDIFKYLESRGVTRDETINKEVKEA